MYYQDFGVMSLASFPTDLEHSLPLDTHMQHVCVT